MSNNEVEKSRISVDVSGRVQGVFFRATTQKVARKYCLTGYVRNEPDRSVKIVAEGKKHLLEKFVEWCYKGSEPSKVDSVNVKWEEYRDEFDGFEITYK